MSSRVKPAASDPGGRVAASGSIAIEIAGDLAAASEPRRSRWGGVIGALLVAPMVAVRIGDPDAFWHIASGRTLLATGQFARDVASFTSGGQVRYTEVLADLAYALTDRAFGIAGYELLHVIVAMVLGALLAWLSVSERPEANGHIPTEPSRPREMDSAVTLAVGATVTCLASLASAPALSAKPQLFTYVLFAWLLLTLRRLDELLVEHPTLCARRSARRTLLALPLAFGLWGYLHRGGTLGLVVFAVAAAFWFVEAGRGDWRRAIGASLLSSCVAMALNPGGLYYFSSAFDVGARSSFQLALVDWRPPTWNGIVSHHVSLIPLLVLAIGGALLRMRLDRAVVVAVITAALFSRSIRFAPLFAIALVPLAGVTLERAFVLATLRVARWVRPGILAGASVVLAFASVARHYDAVIPPAFAGFGVARAGVPVGLAGFLEQHPPPGRMWNSFNFGGYFAYALAPRIRVFIDGRNDTVYSEAFFRDATRAATDAGAFYEQAQRWRIGFAVVAWNGPSDGTFRFLHGAPGWALVYFDDSGAVYVRRTPRAAAYIDQFGYRELRLDTAYGRARGLSADALADATFIAEVLRAERAAPDSMATLYLAGSADRARHDRQAYLEHVGRYLALAYDRGLEVPAP